MKTTDQKGEGLIKMLLILLIVGGIGYAGYVYLWPMVAGSDNPAPQTAATDATPTPGGQPKAGSMAGAAVQGAAAAGEVYGSGR